VAFANDGVAFPVTYAASLLNNGVTLIDAHPVAQLASALLATGVAFAPCLLTTQVAHEITPASLVAVNETVDGFVADAQRALGFKAPGHLLGRQLEVQVVGDVGPLRARALRLRV
jgi:hypothetical protein